jgi:hypothetical protein
MQILESEIEILGSVYLGDVLSDLTVTVLLRSI